MIGLPFLSSCDGTILALSRAIFLFPMSHLVWRGRFSFVGVFLEPSGVALTVFAGHVCVTVAYERRGFQPADRDGGG